MPGKNYDIAIEKLSFLYGSQTILQDIDLEIREGDFLCLLGPSGCGKSTLLRLLAGLATPASGSIKIGGESVKGPGLDRAVVFQDYSLFPWMSAGENIVIALEQAFPGRRKADYRNIALEYLDMVGLGNVYDKLPKQLSGGMKQRAAIVRAFAANSQVLLMDEPFGALDAITRVKLQDILLNLWQQGGDKRKTVVFVTHDVDEALLLASRVAVLGLNPGRVNGLFDVDIKRPRIRKELYHAKEFTSLRESLVSCLHENILDRLDEGQTLKAQGDGI